MMKYSFAILVFVCLSLRAFGQPTDISGWNKARWGMTESQVLEVFEGKATRLANPESAMGLKGRKDAHGSIEIRTLDIQNDKYRAVFIFDDSTSKLIKVSLEPSEKNLFEVQFTRLEQILTEKYGAPSYKNDHRRPEKRSSSGVELPEDNQLTRAWNFPSTIINLVYGAIESVPRAGYIKIDYRKNIRDAIDNL